MELNEEVVKKSLDWLDSLVGNYEENEIAMLTYQLLGILYDTCEELTAELTKKETEYNELYELTEDLRNENERLRGIGTPDDKAYIRLSDAKNAIMDYIGEQTVSKYASEAECKSARSGAEGAMNELDYITPVKVAPIAETVREMSEMLKDYLDDYYHLSEDALLDVPDMIDLIAKEMLEGNNEEG